MTASTWKIFLSSLFFLLTFLLSLFYVGLTSSSKISISRLLEDREKKARGRILESLEEVQAAVEVWRLIFLAALLVSLFLVFPRDHLWPLWFWLFSLALIISGFEILPRLVYRLNRRVVFLWLLPFAGVFRFLGRPVVHFLRKETEITSSTREASDEEIETFIDEAREEGIIEKEEGPLLRSVVEFGDTLVREIMTPRVDMVCLRKEATLAEAKQVIAKEKFSRLPVYRERIDNIEGLVIVKDLLPFSDEEANITTVDKIMRPIHFVPESMKVTDLLKEFQKRKQKMIIVVDEHGGVAGLVTIEDLVEELVGEIQDEYDAEEHLIIPVSEEEYIVSGETEVEELATYLGLDLTSENYITVSGLVNHHLGRLPQKGETFRFQGLEFEIIEANQKRVGRVRIKKQVPSKETNKESK